MRSSSEAEPRSRGRPAPERGETSLEGGDRPSSEAETHPRGATSPRGRRDLT
jgi:hypothetical protein